MVASLKDKVALVTGASSGSGKAICTTLAAHSCSLVMGYYDNRAAIDTLAASLGDEYAHTSLRIDVTDPSSILHAFQLIHSKYGKLDFLINIASYSSSHLWNISPTDISITDWDRVLAVDLTGSFLCAQAAIPLMRKAPYGRILNFGSSGSMRGDANTFAYNPAKCALVGLTKSLARAYAPHIATNLIAPGSIDTGWVERWNLTTLEQLNIHSLREMAGRHGTPDELAALTLFLLTPPAGFITGQTLYFDGGLST